MRGRRIIQGGFVSLITLEQLIAGDHPIRVIKQMCDEVLAGVLQQPARQAAACVKKARTIKLFIYRSDSFRVRANLRYESSQASVVDRWTAPAPFPRRAVADARLPGGADHAPWTSLDGHGGRGSRPALCH